MAGRLVSPTLVGRDTELTVLDKAYGSAEAGTPTHLLISGEAGVGKSRLVREGIERARTRGFQVLEGGCADIGDGGVPFGPFVEAFRTLVRSLDEEAIETLFGPDRTDLARLVPALGPAPDAPRSSDTLGPRLLDAVLAVMHRLAEAAPVVLVVEDLHWADPATRDTIAFLVRQLRDDRILLVMTFRADELHRRHPLLPWLVELERSGRVERVTLERLDAEQTAELLRAILGSEPSPLLVERIHQRSDGNPFFVEELLGSDASAAAGSLSPTLREVLLTRIVALPEPAQVVVRAVAVAGHRIDHDLLASVAGLDDDALIEGLHSAVGQHVLVPTPVSEDDAGGDYDFRHALFQEAVYEDLLPGDRYRLHRAFGAAIAARGPGSGAPAAGHWAELAWHWSAARDAPRSFEASVRAAEAANDAFAFADAVRQGERALGLWPTVEDAEALAGIDRPTLLALVAQAAWLTGDSRRAVALRRAVVDELGDGDPIRLGVATERLGRALWYHGEAAAALDAHERAIALIPEDPPSGELARVLAGYGQVLMLLDRWPEARGVLERAADLARRTGARQAEGHTLSSLGLVLAAQGAPEEGCAVLEHAIEIASEIDDPDDVGRAYVNLSDARRYGGDPAGALEVARRGVIVASQVGLDRTYASFIRANGVQAAYELGAWEVAGVLAAESVGEPGDARGNRRYILTHWLPVLVAQGDERVPDLLQELAAILTDATVEAQFHAPLRITQAEAALWSGEPDAAIVAIRQGVEELPGLGPRWHDIRLLRVGLRAAAETAEVGRARRDPAAVAVAIEAGTTWWAKLDAIVTGAHDTHHGAALDEMIAERSLAGAEHTRTVGDEAIEPWRTVRTRWAARENPYLAAYAGLRLAESELSEGLRAEAGETLRSAHESATSLGAQPLRRELEALATRARIAIARKAAPRRSPSSPLPRDPFGLTARERDVLPLLVHGKTNKQIAETLFISENTAGVHVSNILGKLGASTRTEAAGIAARLGIGDD